MYKQNDDTYLLIDSLDGYSGSSVLEIGVGSGLICQRLIQNFSCVVGIDIDIESIKYCKTHIGGQIHWLCCDGVSAIVGKFDLIVSNPPYLPNDDLDYVQDRTIYGGREGVEATLRFIEDSLPLLKINGKIIIIVSSLANSRYFDDYIAQKNLQKKIITTRRFFFETLYVYELSVRL